jgi:uncharacterized protein (DUF1330 family)
MPKGYWIAFVNVTDRDCYAGYQQLAPAAFARYGARFLAREEHADTMEGEPWQRHVIIEFASKAQALACYHSAEYQQARKFRSEACIATIVIIEGLPAD